MPPRLLVQSVLDDHLRHGLNPAVRVVHSQWSHVLFAILDYSMKEFTDIQVSSTGSKNRLNNTHFVGVAFRSRTQIIVIISIFNPEHKILLFIFCFRYLTSVCVCVCVYMCMCMYCLCAYICLCVLMCTC